MLHSKLPQDEPEKILAATVKPDDILVLDCVMSSGEHRRFEADLRDSFGQYAYERGVPDGPLPLSARPLRLKDEGVEIPRQAELDAGAIGQQGDPLFRRAPLPADAVLTIAKDPFGNFKITTEAAADPGLIYYSGVGSPIDWSHPGTYALCLLFPVTVAIDIVTSPIQAVLLIVYWPKC